MEVQATTPAVSVVVCTYNPRMDLLSRVLDALAKQTLPRPQWELILIDNNSSPPLSQEQLSAGRDLPFRIVVESRQGLVFAKQRAITESLGEVIVFVDDDNFLHADYLETALRIAQAEPGIGAYGGITIAELESGSAPKWKRDLLPFLGVRDNGTEPITSAEDKWGPWEPIGAGMVVRRVVGRHFVDMVQRISGSHSLGRKGSALLAGEDSLIARSACRVGLACSYQPGLKLYHYIKASRLKTRYLARLMYGHGRTVIKLARTLGEPVHRTGPVETIARLLYRILTHGVGGPIWWCWDWGYYAEGKAETPATTPDGSAPAAPCESQS